MSNRQTAAKSPSTAVPIGLLICLALVEAAWLYWILDQKLPNAQAGLKRSYFLWNFLPGIIPGVTWKASFLAVALGNFSEPGNLPQRIPIILAAGFIIAAAFALGGLILRVLQLRSWETHLARLLLAFGIGMSSLGVITLLLGRFGVLSPWLVRIGLLVPVVAELVLIWSSPKVEKIRPTINFKASAGLALITAPFVVAMCLASMLPTVEYDSMEYHLQGPKEYFLNGKISYLPHNVYTSMFFNIEMLHLLGMHLVNDWWFGALVGQLLIASFAPMTGAAIWFTANRWASPRAAWVATIVYMTAPWVYRLAALPYVEGPLCFYHAALIALVGIAWRAKPVFKNKLWVALGLLAGGAMAIKYPGLISAVIPFSLVAIVTAKRDRSFRPVLAFGLGVAVLVGPWMIKNVNDTGNPVYPLAYKVFGGRDWTPIREAKWQNAHGPRPIAAKAFFESILDVAGVSDWQTPALAALAPLAFLRRGSLRVARLIAAYIAYLFLTWWLLTHRLDRFWLPLLPALAVLAGFGADWARSKIWTATLVYILAVSIVTNFADCSSALAGPDEWTGDLDKMRRSVPKMLNPPLFRLDTELPRDAKPLLVAQAAVFHLNHDVVYNTVFDHEIFELIDRDHSPEEVREELKRRGITHVYVDWNTIDRYRAPGNYGFTDYVTPARFDRLVQAGVLSEPRGFGSLSDTRSQQLFSVLPQK